MNTIIRPHSLSEELLSAYVDDQVTPEERQAVESQLAVDPATARQLAELRYAVDLLAELPPVSAPRAFTLSQDQVEPARARWDWLAWLKPAYLRGMMALAAVCLLFLVIGNATFQAGLPAASQQPAVAQLERGGLAAEDGDPTAIIGKASTSELQGQQEQPAGFLGLPSGVLLILEIGLAALLLALLIASRSLFRIT